MTVATTQPRVPGGAPTGAGGQWAEIPRATVDSDLICSLTPEQFQDELKKIANGLRQQFDRADPQDLTTEGWIAYLEALKRLPPVMDGGDLPPLVTNKHVAFGYASRAMRAAAVEAQFGRMSSPDFKARRVFADAEREFLAANGRELTAAEKATLADEIRKSFPPRRRPRPDFYVSGPRTYAMEELPETAAEPDQVYVPEHMVSAIERATSATAAERDRLARTVWPALALSQGAPGIAAKVGTPATGARIVRVFAESGGADAALRAWDTAEDDHPALTRLFAPFGRLTSHDRAAVVETFRAAGRYADDLFAATVATAYTAKEGAAA